MSNSNGSDEELVVCHRLSHATTTTRLASGLLLVASCLLLLGGPATAHTRIPEPVGRVVVEEPSGGATDRPCFLVPHHWNDASDGPLSRCTATTRG